MRIAYVNHTRFPSEKAHGFQTAQVCDALLALGHEVTLVKPAFKNPITAESKEYYGLARGLRVIALDHFDAFQSRFIPGRLGFIASMPSYGNAVRKFLQTSEKFDLLYIRSPYLAGATIKSGVPVIMELHTLPGFFRHRFIRHCKACAKVVCLTNAMRDTLLSWGVSPEKVLVEGDGVDLRRFQNVEASMEAKIQWNLPSGKSVIGYVGSLATRETMEKGVRELIDAFANLNDAETFLWIVGGPKAWEEIYRKHARAKNLSDDRMRFQGRIDVAKVPSALSACDICVYPAPKSDHPYFIRDTSPLKLFEYLAAGRPVVCADLPPIRDVVDEASVRFFEPGNAADLAQAIVDVLEHPDAAKKRAEKGREIAKEHSWEKRMQRILDRIGQNA